MRKKILIVEDDEAQRRMLKIALEREGYTVVTALAGQNALVYGELSHPDLILLDIMLAGHMDGLEVLSKFKASHGIASTPIIMMSALSDEARIQYAREVGAVDYVTKPYELSDLLMRVHSALASRQSSCPGKLVG